MPKTNATFWQRKIERNKERDYENGIKLRQQGWNVITIWECELKRAIRDITLGRLLRTLRAFEKVPAEATPKPSVYRYFYPGDEYNPIAAEPDEEYT